MEELNKNVPESEENFAEMFEESVKDEGSGSVCEGTIVRVGDSDAFVDVKRKSELMLSLDEIKNQDGSLMYSEGDSLDVAFVGNGRVSHRRALATKKVRDFIDAFDPKAETIAEVKFVELKNNGLVGYDKNGVEFFMPSKQCGYRDARQALNKTLQVKVVKVNKEEQVIIASRRKILEAEREKKAALLDAVKNNTEVITGTIRKITSYGMFVDVGGVDGLVHYSEISHRGPVNPSTLYKEGEKVDVKIIRFDEEKKQLSLSIKATLSDPWGEVEENLEVGDTIKVTVSNVEEYGAFVDLGNDVEGFLHISEISWDKNVKDPHKYIKEGDEIDVEVIEINHEKHRLRVSLKNLLPKPFENFKNKFKVGDVVTGSVVSLTDFGAFVSIGGIDGLLHNEDVSWERGGKCKELFKIGDEVEVKIVKIDEANGKISLSKKELTDGPVARYAKNHSAGELVKGKIRDIQSFGVFVNLENGVDGLIRTEDLSEEGGELKVGDEIESTIVFIDLERGRIRLSVRRRERQARRDSLNDFNRQENSKESNVFGDFFQKKF